MRKCVYLDCWLMFLVRAYWMFDVHGIIEPFLALTEETTVVKRMAKIHSGWKQIGHLDQCRRTRHTGALTSGGQVFWRVKFDLTRKKLVVKMSTVAHVCLRLPVVAFFTTYRDRAWWEGIWLGLAVGRRLNTRHRTAYVRLKDTRTGVKSRTTLRSSTGSIILFY